MDTPDVLELISQAYARVGDVATIGAGTVLLEEQVLQAAGAGASFCVSPNVDPHVTAAAHVAGILPVPGAFTATEIALAIRSESRLIKLYPAVPPGPSYLAALRGPFPNVAFAPTGGLDFDDIPSFVQAGAAVIGLGSSLIRDGSTHGLRERARRAVSIVAQAGDACS